MHVIKLCCLCPALKDCGWALDVIMTSEGGPDGRSLSHWRMPSEGGSCQTVSYLSRNFPASLSASSLTLDRLFLQTCSSTECQTRGPPSPEVWPAPWAIQTCSFPRSSLRGIQLGEQNPNPPHTFIRFMVFLFSRRFSDLGFSGQGQALPAVLGRNCDSYPCIFETARLSLRSRLLAFC